MGYGQAEVKSALEAGMMIANPSHTELTRYEFVVVPPGATVASLEALRETPFRIRRHVVLHDVPSFVAYVNRFKGDMTVVSYNEEERYIRAILDYHLCISNQANIPAWCDHTATLNLTGSRMWGEWMATNGRPFGQIEFARFLEDHIHDVREDFQAPLLHVARHLEVKKDVEFTSANRLENGSGQLVFSETVRATSASGSITVPDAFVINAEPIKGGPQLQVVCRFRYRLNDRTLKLWYEIVDAEKAVEQIMRDIRKSVDQGTGIVSFAGTV